MVHLHCILWKHCAPRFDLRAKQLVQEARRLRKGGLVAAAYVQTVKTDDLVEFFASMCRMETQQPQSWRGKGGATSREGEQGERES